MRLMPVLMTASVFLAGSAGATTFEDYDFSRWSQTVTRCDELAAHGRDPGHVAPNVSREAMDKPAAIAACHEAVERDPDNPRLNYQLGRAYGYSGRSEDAMPYRRKALAADYPQSTFTFGYLHLIGAGVERDTCVTLEYWQRSARYKRLAALVSVPLHTMRGDFEGCEGVPTADTMRDYLAEAKSLSSDYYVGLLVEELMDDVDRLTE